MLTALLSCFLQVRDRFASLSVFAWLQTFSCCLYNVAAKQPSLWNSETDLYTRDGMQGSTESSCWSMTGFYFKELEQKPHHKITKGKSIPLWSVYVFTYLNQHTAMVGAWLLSDQSIMSCLKGRLCPNSVISVFSTHELFPLPHQVTQQGEKLFFPSGELQLMSSAQL